MQFLDKNHRQIWLGTVIVILLAIVVGCTIAVRSFFAEDRNPVQHISASKSEPATRLDVNATVLLVDPLRGLMKVELILHPHGDLVKANNRDLAVDLRLLTNNAAGQSQILLKKNQAPHPVEMTLSLLDGDVALYPIDRYNALLELEATVEREGAEPLPVPVSVDFVSHNHSFHAEAALGPDSDAHELNVQISLKRILAAQGFAWFMNGIMVLIGLCGALVTFNIAYRGKKIEAGLMIWMSALLFVLPTIRNTLPGSPPLGSLTDFLVFFWVEGVIALCLSTMVLVWYRRATS